MISLSNAATRLILVKSLSNLEEVYCIKNIQRASNAITNEKNNLLNLAGNYATQNKNYADNIERNPIYGNSNIVPEIFLNLNINFLIVSDNSGQIISAHGYDTIKKVPLTIPPDLLDLISNNPLFHNPTINSASAGIVMINNQPILLAYHPILTDSQSDSLHGLLFIGRSLDDDFAKQLSSITQLSIQIEPYQNSELSLELKSAKRIVGIQDEISVNILGPQSIAGYTVIQDIFGKPALTMRTDMERDIFNNGYTSIEFFIYSVFFGNLCIFILAYILLNKQIISRITTLNKAVTKMNVSGALDERIQTSGNDEISSLSSQINELLVSLEGTDYKFRHSLDEMEKLIEARTAELVQVNGYLQYEIAERELGQKALFEAYNEIQAIISSISSIIIGVDGDQNVTQWNDTAVKIFGIPYLDVIGQEFFKLQINWDWEKITLDVAKCKNNNENVRMDDIALMDKANNNRILGITLTPLILKDKQTPGFLLIGSDITERRMLEQQSGRSSKLEAIGQLAAGVAHEINTPTQLVGSNLRFLGQQLEPILLLIDKFNQLNHAVKNGTATPELATALEKASTAAHLDYFKREAPKAIEQSLQGIDRVSHIVSAMRFFMHPGSENKEMANLNHIIQNALELSHNEWKNVAEIKTEFDPDLPAVDCLPSELSQVILNLIINAVHAIQDILVESPDSLGQIIITTRQLGELVELRISDSGAGIPNEIRNKVFDPFFTTKDVGRGTGQGLAIAYTVIVKKHQGTLEFESELGKGTTFIIHIPRKTDHE